MMEPLTLQEIMVKSIDDFSFFHKYMWLLPVRQRKNYYYYYCYHSFTVTSSDVSEAIFINFLMFHSFLVNYRKHGEVQ